MGKPDLSRLTFNTLCVHGSGGVDPTTGAVSVPIYQSSTFAFESAEQGAAIFAGEREGYFYTRLGNPTQAAFEREVAFLERGEAALATSSGMAATATAVFALVQAGDNLVASGTLYGGTHKFFRDLLPRYGVEARYVDANDAHAIGAAIDSKTKLFFVETPANPTLGIVDLALAAREAKRHGIPLFVDNTFATPYYQRPLTLGADVVIHSATKYIGGHGDTVAGVIIGAKEFLTRCRFEILRDLGGVISPFNAWLLLRGLKTLEIRMRRHTESATELAGRLEEHPGVERVRYPGFGGLLSFDVAGGADAARTVETSTRTIRNATSLGGVDSVLETRHRWEGDRVPENLIRLSVGLEDVEELWADLDGALAAVGTRT